MKSERLAGWGVLLVLVCTGCGKSRKEVEEEADRLSGAVFFGAMSLYDGDCAELQDLAQRQYNSYTPDMDALNPHATRLKPEDRAAILEELEQRSEKLAALEVFKKVEVQCPSEWGLLKAIRQRSLERMGLSYTR